MMSSVLAKGPLRKNVIVEVVSRIHPPQSNPFLQFHQSTQQDDDTMSTSIDLTMEEETEGKPVGVAPGIGYQRASKLPALGDALYGFLSVDEFSDVIIGYLTTTVK
jgi:hypothetical protein